MLSLSAALRRFHPGGLLAPATDGSRGVVTRLPSRSMALPLLQLAYRGDCHGWCVRGTPDAQANTLARACGDR